MNKQKLLLHSLLLALFVLLVGVSYGQQAGCNVTADCTKAQCGNCASYVSCGCTNTTGYTCSCSQPDSCSVQCCKTNEKTGVKTCSPVLRCCAVTPEMASGSLSMTSSSTIADPNTGQEITVTEGSLGISDLTITDVGGQLSNGKLSDVRYTLIDNAPLPVTAFGVRVDLYSGQRFLNSVGESYDSLFSPAGEIQAGSKLERQLSQSITPRSGFPMTRAVAAITFVEFSDGSSVGKDTFLIRTGRAEMLEVYKDVLSIYEKKGNGTELKRALMIPGGTYKGEAVQAQVARGTLQNAYLTGGAASMIALIHRVLARKFPPGTVVPGPDPTSASGSTCPVRSNVPNAAPPAAQ